MALRSTPTVRNEQCSNPVGGVRLDFKDVKRDSAKSVFSGKDPTLGVFDFDFDALEPYQGFQEKRPFQVKHFDSDEDEPGSRFPLDRDDESDSGSDSGPVMASTLPPRSRPPCGGCGAPPVIVAGNRGLCGRCATRMMDVDPGSVSDDSD